MTTSTIDESPRKAARVAGFFYVLTFAIVVAVNFGINERLMVAGDPAQTARNILAHERLFRIGIASNLVYEAGLLALLSALCVTLGPVGRTLALLAAFWRLVYASMWVLMSLNQLTALRLLNGADYLRVLGTEQAQTLGRLYLSGFDAYYVGLLFYGLASTACSYLFFKSGYIPRGLAAFGVIVSTWAAACTLAFIISPDFAKHVNLWWFDTGLGLFELATGFWLVIKGLRPEMTMADRAAIAPESRPVSGQPKKERRAMDALDRQARTAGWLYLLLVIPGPFVLIYLPSKLIVRGDAAATAANLLAHEKLFRFGMVADVAGSVFFLVLAFALYRLLSRVDRTQAAFMVALVMVSSAIACVNVLPNAAALALARASESLTVLDQTQREALAMLFLRLHSIGNTVNETFWGLWLVPFGMLVYRSGFLPRFLGAWLVVNGAAYVALSGIGLMRPELSGKAFLYAQPLLFGELAIMLWLIIKGAKQKPLAATT